MIEAAKKSDRVLQIGLQPPQQPALTTKSSTKSAKAPSVKSFTPSRPTTTTVPQSATAKKPRPPRRSTTICGRARQSPSRTATTSSRTTGTTSGTGATPKSATARHVRYDRHLCRWALGVDYPTKVTASGSKLRYDDDQQTPDTCNIIADFDGRTLVWEGLAWSPAYKPLSGINIELRGDAGAIFFEDSGYRLFNAERKLVVEDKHGSHGWNEHLTNFIEAVRNGREAELPDRRRPQEHQCSPISATSRIAPANRSKSRDPSNGFTSKTVPLPTNSGHANTAKAGSPASHTDSIDLVAGFARIQMPCQLCNVLLQCNSDMRSPSLSWPRSPSLRALRHRAHPRRRLQFLRPLRRRHRYQPRRNPRASPLVQRSHRLTLLASRTTPSSRATSSPPNRLPIPATSGSSPIQPETPRPKAISTPPPAASKAHSAAASS